MPRPTVYGKTSRAYGGTQALTFSSPEQQRWKPSDKEIQQVDESRNNTLQGRKCQRESTAARKLGRAILKEKNANAVGIAAKEDQAKNIVEQDLESERKRKPRDGKTRKAPRVCNEEAEVYAAPVDYEAGQILNRETDIKDSQLTDSRAASRKTRQAPKTPSTRTVTPSKDDDDGETRNLLSDEGSCIYEQHCSSLLSLSLHPESSFQSFHTWSTELSAHFDVSKIAEASFGEVYRLSLNADITGFGHADESVFKIIALKSPPGAYPKAKRARNNMARREENMSHPEDVANEVRLLQRMSCIPGFTNFRDVRILQGPPASLFVDAFREFDKSQRASGKEGSHFPDPGQKGTYSSTQLWAVIEMQDAGTDLERLVEAGLCKSIWSTWDIFWSVVLALAKGEQGAQFEHRDLHLGNICVHMQPTPTAEQKLLDLDIDLNKKLSFTNVETTIIDYTISRAALSSPPESSDRSAILDGDCRDLDIAYHDLALDSAIFEGDSTDEYQYDIYRYMRGVFLSDNAYGQFETQSGNKARSWSGYRPQTNLVWLHFVLYKLLSQVSWPSKIHKPKVVRSKRKHAGAGEAELRRARWTRGNELEEILLRLQELLDPGQICANGLLSAGDLVALALSEGWLDVEDVLGECAGVEFSTDEQTQLEDAMQALSV